MTKKAICLSVCMYVCIAQYTLIATTTGRK